MDSLKTLLDQKKYDLVLKLTEGSTSPSDLFYRISAYIYLSKYEDALFVIQDNQKTLESNLSSLINVHINLLCALGRFDQAYSTLDYYNNLPYESQVVEEVLRKMPELIALEEKKQATIRFYDDEQIEKYLKSDSLNDVLIGLDALRNRDILPLLDLVQYVLLNHPKQLVRSYALMLLVQKEVDRPIKMKSLDEIIEVNPKHLNPPFTSSVFNETIRLMNQEYKDPTLTESATQLYSEYEMYLYPRSIKEAPKDLSAAFYIIARKYANQPVKDLDTYFDAMELDKNHINDLINDIEEKLGTL
ncbi:MAG: hypothetical protein J6M95_02220 [Bacilli bacterium]|nr:hypothetical protein [Bacilli bacterium]